MPISESVAPLPLNVAEFLQRFTEENRVHAKSLISTLFGDVVMPNDGFTWVETITAALQPLGINERLVRTSLFRLREEGWVDATRSGRKSFYQLTERAKSQTRLAERLIYYHDIPPWDGAWTLVFLVVQPLEAELRHQLEQELAWIGFGSVTKNVWAHPGAKSDLVAERVDRLGLKGAVICMRCENIYDVDLGFTADDRELASLCLPVAEVESDYQYFNRAFSPLLDDQKRLSMSATPAELLALRLLIMDEFRRVMLRDPHLPLALLPADWAGLRAYRLCATIYKQISQVAYDRYVSLQYNADPKAKTATNLGYTPESGYLARFKGI